MLKNNCFNWLILLVLSKKDQSISTLRGSPELKEFKEKPGNQVEGLRKAARGLHSETKTVCFRGEHLQSWAQ